MTVNKEWTTGEYAAYLQGYEDGWDAGHNEARAGVKRVVTTGKGLPDCLRANPDVMCEKCNCWKSFRMYCS